jgi:OOP family OmpA-OmpF porin
MRVQAQAIRICSVVLAGLLGACAAPATGPAANGGPAAAAATPSKPTVGQEIAAVADNKITVTFPEGGAVLTPDANKQLDLAARLYRDANPVAMFTAGYTDRTGDEFGNLLLSAQRARAVKGGLVARGIPADRLLIQAFGSSELANSSDPQAPENRRVVVTWRLL